MAQQHTFHALFVIGVIFLVIMLVRLFVNRRWCPPMLVFLLIGIIVGQVVNGDMASEHLSIRTILSALGEAGLIMLLFKVGINADLKGLRAQLPNASWIWLWNVLLSGGLGYVAAYWILSFDFITSLFIAIAFTATSVGVTVSLWSEAGKLSTPQGILLLDVAELDDLSTICLVAMLVALLPLYYSGVAIQPLDLLLNLGYIVLLLVAFAVSAWFFSLHVEPRLTRTIVQRAVAHELVVFMVAVSFIVAALAEISGLSLAIGAFIAGLAFSRDPSAMLEQPVLNSLYDFLTPFFFISLGMMFDITSLDGLIWPAAILVLFAVVGKVLGVMLPAWSRLGMGGALLLGVSMVPRMEIAMVVMQKGLEAGISQSVFSTMILACFMTVLITMLGLPFLLRRIPL